MCPRQRPLSPRTSPGCRCCCCFSSKTKPSGERSSTILIARRLLLHCGCHWHAFSRSVRPASGSVRVKPHLLSPAVSFPSPSALSPRSSKQHLAVVPAGDAQALSSLLSAARSSRSNQASPFLQLSPHVGDCSGCTEQALSCQPSLGEVSPAPLLPCLPPAFQIHHLAWITIVSCVKTIMICIHYSHGWSKGTM